MMQYSPVWPVVQGDETVLGCIDWDGAFGRVGGHVHVVVRADDAVLAFVDRGQTR